MSRVHRAGDPSVASTRAEGPLVEKIEPVAGARAGPGAVVM
jgi:hypothetical protein